MNISHFAMFYIINKKSESMSLKHFYVLGVNSHTYTYVCLSSTFHQGAKNCNVQGQHLYLLETNPEELVIVFNSVF